MKAHSYEGKLSAVARLFLYVSVTVITIASFLGAGGVMTGCYFLLKLHPYIFFIGFGNLAILILNRYLTATIYPELKVDPRAGCRMPKKPESTFERKGKGT